MSDETLREHYRQWKSTGDAAAEGDYLKGMRRAGNLSLEHLRLLAYAGSLPAVEILGIDAICWCRIDRRGKKHTSYCPLAGTEATSPTLVIPKDIASWTQGLTQWGQVATAQAVYAGLAYVLSQSKKTFEEGHSVTQWLTGIECWLLCPCLTCQEIIPARSRFSSQKDLVFAATRAARSACAHSGQGCERRTGEDASIAVTYMLKCLEKEEPELLRAEMRQAVSGWLLGEQPVMNTALARLHRWRESGGRWKRKSALPVALNHVAEQALIVCFGLDGFYSLTDVVLSAAIQSRKEHGCDPPDLVLLSAIRGSGGDATVLSDLLPKFMADYEVALDSLSSARRV